MRALVLFCLSVSGVLLSTASGQGAAGTRARQVEAGLPIVFEPVTDRQGGAAGLVGRAEGLSLGFAPAAVDFAPGGRTSDRFRITFSGARPVTPVGDALQRSQTNYLVGSDPAQWRTHVPNFARVRYAGLYPGVDAVFYGNGRAMEHDFVVAPGADAAQIRMHFSDGARVSIDGEGALRIELKGGMLQMKRPILYQEEDGRRQSREGQLRVLPDGDVGFAIASYDHRRELVIDPVLSFATYLSSVAVDGSLLAIDASGNNYVTGATGVGFPVTTGAFAGCGGCGASATVMFLSKLSADGKSLVYSTVLGGNAAAQPTGIVVDASGDALVAGITAATDFPTKNGQPVTAPGGNNLGFLVSLSPDGSSLNYGTMLGSSPASGLSSATYAQAVAVDDSGNAFVTGETGAGFATTPGALNQGGGTSSGDSFNVYVAKFSATGGLVYSAVLGAADPQNGADGPIGASAIAVDAAGDAFVAGQAGTLWPITSNAYQSQIAGPMPSAAPFVTKVAPDGSSLLYSTYLDYAYVVAGIAVLPNGNVFVAGSGAGSTYPTTPGAYQANSGGGSFVSELNATGSALVFSTIVGDPYYTLNAFALDVGGDLWLAGTTTNASFALVNPLQGTFPIEPLGVTNASTLSELDPTGHTLKFSTFLGGVASGSANSVAIDASLRAHVGGTAEYGLYTTPGAYLGSVPMLAPAYEGETFAYVNVVDPTVPAPGLCAIPNNGLNFLGTAIGSSPQEVVSLTNCGTQPLTISSVTAAGSTFMVPASEMQCAQTLAVGQSCALLVQYTPTAAQADASTLTITSNAPVTQAVMRLSGIGVSEPFLTLSPASLTFAPQLPGTTSTAQMVTLTNSGTVDLTGAVVALIGANPTSFVESSNCGPTLRAGGGVCTISVSFAPTTVGAASAGLTVENAGSGLTPETILMGTGAQTAFAITPQTGASTSATVAAGQPASYSLSASAAAGYTGTLALTCTGLPANASCSFAPPSLTLAGGQPATFTVAIATQATVSAALLHSAGLRSALAGLVVLLPLVGTRRRLVTGMRALLLLTVVGFGVVGFGVTGCGGSSHSSTPGPVSSPTVAPGTYSVQVVASDGTTKQTQTLTLIVQ